MRRLLLILSVFVLSCLGGKVFTTEVKSLDKRIVDQCNVTDQSGIDWATGVPILASKCIEVVQYFVTFEINNNPMERKISKEEYLQLKIGDKTKVFLPFAKIPSRKPRILND